MQDGLLPIKNMFMQRQLKQYQKKKKEVRKAYFKNRAKSFGPSSNLERTDPVLFDGLHVQSLCLSNQPSSIRPGHHPKHLG